MKNNFLHILKFIMIAFFLSCSSDREEIAAEQENMAISQDILNNIADMGYSTDNIEIFNNPKYGLGYIVEGDIILYSHNFDNSTGLNIRIAENEQYSTNLLPIFGYSYFSDRYQTTIRRQEQVIVLLDLAMPNDYFNALQEAANRYNDENLRFRLEVAWDDGTYRSSSIIIRPGAGNFLAAAGFPRENTYTTRGGDTVTEIIPHDEIIVNVGAIGNEPENHLATILAHEIGHCIGFRHTDYFNRSYSCGAGTFPNDEGEGNIGAVHIPGTPTSEDANSWMLACIDDGVNRPFVQNDVVALQYVHGW